MASEEEETDPGEGRWSEDDGEEKAAEADSEEEEKAEESSDLEEEEEKEEEEGSDPDKDRPHLPRRKPPPSHSSPVAWRSWSDGEKQGGREARGSPKLPSSPPTLVAWRSPRSWRKGGREGGREGRLAGSHSRRGVEGAEGGGVGAERE